MKKLALFPAILALLLSAPAWADGYSFPWPTMPTGLIYPSPLISGGATPSLAVAPTGNTASTLSTISAQSTTGSSTTREYLVNLGLISNKGTGVGTPGGDKVVLYTGMVARAGTGDVWSFNPLLTLDPASGTYSGQVIEVDLNNNNADVGGADGGTGLTPPSVYGLTLSGAGAFESTAALGISGPNSPIYHRGIVFANNSISDATIQDLTTSTVSLDIRGSHTYGLDFNNMAGTPIRIANNTALYGRNAAGNADLQLLQLNNGDNLVLGAGAGAVFAAKNIAPTANNSFSSGTSSNRWANTYSVLGDFSSGVTVSGFFTATGLVTLPDVATQAANTVVGNATAGSASPTALTIVTCSAASSALKWTSNAGFGCNASLPYVLGQSHIPFVLLSSGTMGNNGAVSGITAVAVAYPSAYCYVPAGAIAAASLAGWYYCTFGSTTAPTLFNNKYDTAACGTPTIPGSPASFVTTGPGAYTQTIGTYISAYCVTVPANALGVNGSIEMAGLASMDSSASVKNLEGTYGAFMFGVSAPAASTNYGFYGGLSNRGVTNVQTQLSGANFTTGAVNGAPTFGAVDSTQAQTLALQLRLATVATDTQTLENVVIKILPGV